VKACWTHDPKTDPPGNPGLCRATEPVRSLYLDAFRHHIRGNGVRLLKFDNLTSVCSNPNHEHLPGIYSTEAIQNAVIEFLNALDQECPDVFLMLYWGHRSPWWLLHADTLFDSGIGIEAASPSDFAAPYARDSITQKLDQAQRYASDVPPLGKDSLGVWLSDWGWNSSVGKERWQEGFLMDLCRGSLLAQPWSDTPWLSPPERRQMADFIALLKAHPECFGNPRFILGDPWKGEPYGYCCTDGKRAFLALNNCTWNDARLTLQLGPAWGLPARRKWDLYRWYSEPARLRRRGASFGETATVCLRPFEVTLIEVVPAGQAPSLGRPFREKPILMAFVEASRPVEVAAALADEGPRPPASSVWAPLKLTSFASAGGATLTQQEDGSLLAGGESPSDDTYTIAAKTDLAGTSGIRLELLPDPTLPGGGPGRAENGNFMLNELRVTAAPLDGSRPPVPVALRNPAASFSQDSYGGWPVEASIDDRPGSGWSIHPMEGVAHEAVFETAAPVGFPGGTALTFTMRQGERRHSVGRFRLSVTSAQPPLPAPARRGPLSFTITGQAPASDGLLVVTVEMKQGSAPLSLPNVGSYFDAEAKLGAESVACTPVLGKATYPAPWQAWRIAVPASEEAPTPFTLQVRTSACGAGSLTWRGHFVPAAGK